MTTELDWWERKHRQRHEDERDMDNRQERRLIGKCPSCGGGVAVETIYDRWPLIHCGCGWKGGVPEVKNQRIEGGR